LAPDVIKNTNLKVAHRVVALDDRASLAGAMAMNDRQVHALATLTVGQAAVFSEGDDAPVLVQVPERKPQSGASLPNDAEVAGEAAGRGPLVDTSLLLPFPSCAETCTTRGPACDAARHIVEDPQFQRVFAHSILSIVEDASALDRVWPNLLSVVLAKRPRRLDEQELNRCVMVRAAHWFAGRRGAQAQWTYSETETLESKLRQMLLARLREERPEASREEFREYARSLHARQYPPFLACEQICRQQPAVCLYRYAVADLIGEGRYSAGWQAAEEADATQEGYPQTWQLCLRAGYDLIEFPAAERPDSARESQEAVQRTCLCFAQQMLLLDAGRAPATIRWITERLIAEAEA
jgi:hypothetical protein